MRDRIDWQRTAAIGGGAWLVGYVLSFVIVAISGADRDGSGTTDVATWAYVEGMGGLYEISLPMGGSTTATQLTYGSMRSNFWGAGVFLHYLVPAVVLVVAGYVLAGEYATDARRSTPGGRFEAWVGGVSLVVVFGALTFLAAYVMSPSGASPDVLRLLIAAIVYPVVFAGIGAARRVGIDVLSLRAAGVGLLGFLAMIALWNFVEDPIGAAGLTDLSGADEYLPYLGKLFVDLGVAITPGQQSYLLDYSPSGTSTDPGVVGPGGIALVLLLGPAVAAGVLVYRESVTDPIRGLGAGARTAAGYLLGVALLTIAVLAQRMNFLYNELYGTGTEEAVREELIHDANVMFGAILPQVLLVAGVLLAAFAAGIGGAVGAKVAASQQESAPAESAAASGAPQQAE
ncbi:hypothetical protein GCM10028857_27330 [Salinarchaeum chitinilyticum]